MTTSKDNNDIHMRRENELSTVFSIQNKDGRKQKGGLTFINIQYQYHSHVIMYNVMLLLTQNNTGINYIKNSNSLYSNVF